MTKRTSPKKKKKYKNDLMASLHETAEGLHKVGAIDKKTMRKFDKACLTDSRQRTKAGESIIKGAEEALAFLKGEADPKKYRVHIREKISEKRTTKKRGKSNRKSRLDRR